ncbi:hypothetical protein BYT27DRAFT_7240658 [Phlegmacium glaucopus]|nr:hypothetical protein BYT27DRAFT_7240658 [Phlegmacium glaucopus]
MIFSRFINAFTILLFLHVVTGAPMGRFRTIGTAVRSIHRLANKNGNVVGKIRPQDWEHSPHHEDENKMMIQPDMTKGLSYRTHPPSVINKKSANYEIDEKHFKGTGLEVVHDGGKGELPLGHASLVWAGEKSIEAEDLKNKINGLHAEHGKVTKGDSKDPNNYGDK